MERINSTVHPLITAITNAPTQRGASRAAHVALESGLPQPMVQSAAQARKKLGRPVQINRGAWEMPGAACPGQGYSHRWEP